MDRVLILGATSTIAAEVARVHAERGDRLHLVGRNGDKLADVAVRCRATNVTTSLADFQLVDDAPQVVHDAVAALGGLGRVLIAHGDLGDQALSERSFAEAQRILDVNLVSVIALLLPLAQHCERERHGRIGVITSVAGDRGRPRNYTYGAAKAALNTYLQGLRTQLYASGVAVTTLKIGPVDTPMTRSHKKNLLFAEAPDVAQAIVAAMDAGTPEAYIPAIWRAIMPIVRSTPERLFQLLPFLSGR